MQIYLPRFTGTSQSACEPPLFTKKMICFIFTTHLGEADISLASLFNADIFPWGTGISPRMPVIPLFFTAEKK